MSTINGNEQNEEINELEMLRGREQKRSNHKLIL